MMSNSKNPETAERDLSPIKVLLVDDNTFHRGGVRRYLKQKGFHVFEAGDEATAWQIASAQTPAVAVIDISIPPSPDQTSHTQYSFGLNLAERLKDTYPTMGVVLFSAYEDRGQEVFAMLHAGKRGLAYKLKGCRPSALLSAIHTVRAGRIEIDPEVQATPPSLLTDVLARLSAVERAWVERVLDNLDGLTPREREVVDLLAASYNTLGIAAALGITPKTADNHISHIYEKLGLNELVNSAPHLRQSSVLAKACLIQDLKARGTK
jgi:DNA-binding NarL/FixJ family response regulator